MMKKFISLLCVLVFVFAFVACGQPAKSDDYVDQIEGVQGVSLIKRDEPYSKANTQEFVTIRSLTALKAFLADEADSSDYVKYNETYFQANMLAVQVFKTNAPQRYNVLDISGEGVISIYSEGVPGNTRTQNDVEYCYLLIELSKAKFDNLTLKSEIISSHYNVDRYFSHNYSTTLTGDKATAPTVISSVNDLENYKTKNAGYDYSDVNVFLMNNTPQETALDEAFFKTTKLIMVPLDTKPGYSYDLMWVSSKGVISVEEVPSEAATTVPGHIVLAVGRDAYSGVSFTVDMKSADTSGWIS